MAKTDFLTADMTRRQFMKISGKSLAGLTLSASMLSLFGCSQKQVDSGAVANRGPPPCPRACWWSTPTCVPAASAARSTAR